MNREENMRRDDDERFLFTSIVLTSFGSIACVDACVDAGCIEAVLLQDIRESCC